MRILVLGGTSFLGRAIVEDALRAGAEVTLFGRGKTGTDLFPGLVRLIGDRLPAGAVASSGVPLPMFRSNCGIAPIKLQNSRNSPVRL